MNRIKFLCSIFLFCFFRLSVYAAPDGYMISGPFSYKNLSVFLLHGEDTVKNKTIITLEEAMEQKKIIVYETESVNQITVNNVSGNVYIYIQSGDIVKGGKQDRVLQYDYIIPPRSGKIPVKSFCVEQDRWNRRGGEEEKTFSRSEKQLSSKKLKIAAKSKSSQQEVWSEVSKFQDTLGDNMGAGVRDRDSESSLQLTLENKKVKKESKKYITELSEIAYKRKNIIGYIFAINGEINSADIYSQAALFRKLWPKLLESSSIEAISEYKNNRKFKNVTRQDVSNWFAELSKRGKRIKKGINKYIDLDVKESEDNIMFETYEKGESDKWIHRNYIKK
ncbi:MAG: hypothetical protein KKH98_06835 [Spirochaetes bacterium]|nr:hypothetical protein [Spirochaetota bacterium]